jgi:hypothetical protein
VVVSSGPLTLACGEKGVPVGSGKTMPGIVTRELDEAEIQGICRVFRVSDRTRTGDHLDHNQELYQLSYAHRAPSI